MEKEKMVENINAVVLDLLNYCQKYDWAGWDPYDALNSKLFKLLPFLNFRIPRLVLIQLLKRSPVNLRKALLIPKTHNPKALALFLTTSIKLAELGIQSKEEIVRLIDKIEAMSSPGEQFYCWGYSFPWQTRTIIVPRGAPNLVCTTFVANALLDTYEFNADENCLHMAQSAAYYIMKDLYWTKGDSVASFCYPTPSSRSLVHNANFLGAALLSRVYRYTKDRLLLDAALKTCRYSASRQEADGAWYYGEHSTQRWIDNFHTGYNLVALKRFSEYTGIKEFNKNIRKGFKFYIDNFFTEDGVAKYYHNRTYPIDIHSIAQSIITLAEFKELDQNAMIFAKKVIRWSVEYMQSQKSYFYYQKMPRYKNKISYMRWSQAWMLYAMVLFLKDLEEGNGIHYSD